MSAARRYNHRWTLAKRVNKGDVLKRGPKLDERVTVEAVEFPGGGVVKLRLQGGDVLDLPGRQGVFVEVDYSAQPDCPVKVASVCASERPESHPWGRVGERISEKWWQVLCDSPIEPGSNPPRCHIHSQTVG